MKDNSYKEEMENINLMYMPHTRKLLINYILNEYQENAVITEDYLTQEYNYLRDNNLLERLFKGEYLHSPERLKLIFG